ILALGAFQRFLVIAGRKAVYLYEGTTPVGEDADFQVVGSFPQGIVGRFGLADIGNDLLYVTDSGVQSIRLVVDANAVNRQPISEPIRTTLVDLIPQTSEDDIQVVHYPRRSWCLVKIGTQVYNYNYAPTGDRPQENL